MYFLSEGPKCMSEGLKMFFMGEGAIFQVINAYKGRGLSFDPSVRTYPEWHRN